MWILWKISALMHTKYLACYLLQRCPLQLFCDQLCTQLTIQRNKTWTLVQGSKKYLQESKVMMLSLFPVTGPSLRAGRLPQEPGPWTRCHPMDGRWWQTEMAVTTSSSRLKRHQRLLTMIFQFYFFKRDFIYSLTIVIMYKWFFDHIGPLFPSLMPLPLETSPQHILYFLFLFLITYLV